MIENIIEYSIKNRFIIIIMVAVGTMYGLYTMFNMPVDAIPDLSENQVIVFADWMGRSSKEIEDQVTYPLSVNLQGLAGVKAVRSSSEFNFSMIDIIFEDNIDYYFARQRVLERLSIASTFLPEGVVPYLAPDATALGQIFWYTVEGDGYDLSELRTIQDFYVKYQLNSIPGVAQVATAGGAPREYHIDINPDKLRIYNVTLSEVYSAIARSNLAVGGRVVHKGNAEYVIRGVGLISSLRDIENIVITQRNNIPVYVKNVAVAQLGTDFRRSVLEKNNKEATGGVVMMRYGENPLTVTKAIHEKIRDIEKGLPAGIKIVSFYDRTELIQSAIETLRDTLKEEIIVAGLIVLLILGHFGSAFVICLTLPITVLMSFIIMKYFGVASNIMSLSGIAISIGILVDQAIVMVENATHALHAKFPDGRIKGDTSDILIEPCKMVGRPIFFAVLIMVISFLPVFALSGMEGKMFHPLAFTKTFALISVSILSITLVPALIPTFIRGKIYKEEESWIVRSFIDIYKPVLTWLIDRPKLVIWLFVIIIALGFHISQKLGREFMPPLNEGSILEMPTTVPRVSAAQVIDDLKMRDAVIRRFPEIGVVVGKAGRADTPTDPAPLDMVETIINLRGQKMWPKRKLEYSDALMGAKMILDTMEVNGFVKLSAQAKNDLINAAAMSAIGDFDNYMRELSLQRIKDFENTTMENSVKEKQTDKFIMNLDYELFEKGTKAYIEYAIRTLNEQNNKKKLYLKPISTNELDVIKNSVYAAFADKVFLWKKNKSDIVKELDSVLQMPGWGNIWTQPIINRVDMLATGVRTMIGVKVFGDDSVKIQAVSNKIADVLRKVKGAVDVFADQNVGKPYLEISVNREKAARFGISVEDIQNVIEIGLGGKVATTTLEGRMRFPVRVRYGRDFREDEEKVRKILVSGSSTMAAQPMNGSSGGGMGGSKAKKGGMGSSAGSSSALQLQALSGQENNDTQITAPIQVPLEEVADIYITEGPAMIKSENGMLRSYVQLNVRDRDIIGFVEEAKALISSEVSLPAGMVVEWSGQFEHQVRAKKTLQIIFPIVIFLIFIILYMVYSDFAHAFLMMLAVPGAIAGGVMFQYFFGYNFSVAVWVGYIACFGMATETGIIMLVYLRDAIRLRGGLEKIEDLDELKKAVIEGAVHRLRPKLLTEGTAIIGLAPMLWAKGTGAEIMRPMAAPVMGGLLMSDEVIDIFLPVLFYHIEKYRWKKLHNQKMVK
ncbi:MAG: efflux RND transporter permease subunit [Candidatus Wallbacteria bacterium]